jgi:hypothetical protein
VGSSGRSAEPGSRQGRGVAITAWKALLQEGAANVFGAGNGGGPMLWSESITSLAPFWLKKFRKIGLSPLLRGKNNPVVTVWLRIAFSLSDR